MTIPLEVIHWRAEGGKTGWWNWASSGATKAWNYKNL